jgi:hypothetical protein
MDAGIGHAGRHDPRVFGPTPRTRHTGGASRHARRFPGTSFRPVHVRGVLRDVCEPGERAVGWGMAQHEPAAHRAAISIALMLIPGVGQLLAAGDVLLSLSKQRLVILTDRRLVLVRMDKRGPLSRDVVTLDVSIGEVEIEDRDEGARWWIVDDDPSAPDHGARRPHRRADRSRKDRRSAKDADRSADAQDSSGVARLLLRVAGEPEWTMRIAPGKAGGALRLVEALRLISKRDATHPGSTGDGMLDPESVEENTPRPPAET